MKSPKSILVTILLSALSVFNPAAANAQDAQDAQDILDRILDQNQQSHSQQSSSSSSSSSSRSVTVTSDGRRTIKKTVIMKNGVEETITEITDENGNTTTTRTGGNRDAQPGEGGNDQEGGAWLGIRVKEVSEAIRAQLGLPANQGVLVDAIASDCPADAAGIQEGDLILSLDGESISSPAELAEMLRVYEPGAKVEIEIMRGGQGQTVEVTLTAQPENPNQPGTPPARGGNGGAGGGGGGAAGGDAGGGGQIQVEIDGGNFESILSDPNVPEEFKKTVREMQRKMEEFRQKHQLPPAD